MRRYSVIVPVYNRPEEVDELLESLCHQSIPPFEILIVEDGSSVKCDYIVAKYDNRLPVKYYYKENSGQGFSRNFGFEKARGEYLIVFDSDCIIPEDYFMALENHLDEEDLDAFGGPDKAAEHFTLVQKAISYSMTSPITTGGIRGNKRHSGTFHPRSFNMGISKKVFDSVGGYKITRMGEDIEYSIRIIETGFRTGLINEAFVYHKRRTNFYQFFKQLRFFGRARINVSRFYPAELKLIHILPLLFLLGQLIWIVGSFFDFRIFILGATVNFVFILFNFVLALSKFGNLIVAFLGIVAAYVQLLAYGSGLLTEGVKKIIWK